jgi:hypothetical protein
MQGATTLPSARHCTILEIDDSLGTDLGEGLRLQLEKNPAITLVVKTTVAAGLTNSWFYNWPGRLKKFLAQHRPQLLIVFLGANDEQAMVVNGHAAPFDTRAWRSQYESNLTTVMKEAAAVHCVARWVGMPIMNPFGYRQKMQVINSIFFRRGPQDARRNVFVNVGIHGGREREFPLQRTSQWEVAVDSNARRYSPNIYGPESPRHLRRDPTTAHLRFGVDAGLSRQIHPLSASGADLAVTFDTAPPSARLLSFAVSIDVT